MNADPEGHPYLSTACIHEMHHHCPKQCRYCESLCECECHEAAVEPEAPAELKDQSRLELVTQ